MSIYSVSSTVMICLSANKRPHCNCQHAASWRREAARRQPNRAVRDSSKAEKISNRCKRECIVFERTRETEQRIHKPWACLWVSCSSRLQPIVEWIHLRHTRMAAAFARWNFLLPVAKKSNNAAKFNVSLKQNNSRATKKRKEKKSINERVN